MKQRENISINELDKKQFKVPWIDGFKALLVRFEFSVRNWMSLHFIAFSIIFLRKINKKESLNSFSKRG